LETPAEAARSPWPVFGPPSLYAKGELVLGPSPVVALYASGGDPSSLVASAAAAQHVAVQYGRPILGCCDGFLPTAPLPGVDWLGLEVYATTPTESVASVRARLERCLAALPSSQPIVLIGQAYDRAGWYQGDTLGLNLLALSLAQADPRVVALLAFAYGRPGGCAAHPDWAVPYTDYARTIPPPWSVGGVAPQPLPTGIKVLYPGPSDTSTLSPYGKIKLCEFAPDTAADGVTARVELRDGSVHMSYWKGSTQLALTGKRRPVRFP
jgi:hypothetical protein